MVSNPLTWDAVPEQTAVTANPAAGVLSVDVKTFTGRGRVTHVACSCVADANVASRTLAIYKISGANPVTLATSGAFAATVTGYMEPARGVGAASRAIGYGCFPEIEFAPGDILRVTVVSGQAGDDMSAITCSYKEML